MNGPTKYEPIAVATSWFSIAAQLDLLMDELRPRLRPASFLPNACFAVDADVGVAIVGRDVELGLEPERGRLRQARLGVQRTAVAELVRVEDRIVDESGRVNFPLRIDVFDRGAVRLAVERRATVTPVVVGMLDEAQPEHRHEPADAHEQAIGLAGVLLPLQPVLARRE